MRKTVLVLAAALVASLGAIHPAAAPVVRAADGVKIAIIVGATHDVTPRYRADADELYAEAIKYTDNVVRVYSPRATASRVRTAVSGASVIIYLGHGNGWPSPYTYDPNYTTKDGFGLNADLNGDGKTTDNENKYYGEPWIRDLDPAPNAVVLLFHLCYASGNSEPGDAAPSLSTAKKRVDNYAAAFLRAGARAVVASGHSHDPYYIRALFTTRQTIEEYWRNSPDARGNFASYPSERNPGYTFEMDPERAGSYYRSIAGKMSLTTKDVTGAPYADTSRDPSAMVVPGNATPAWDGAPLFGSVQGAQGGDGSTPTPLAGDAQVRVDGREWATSLTDGSPIYRVHTDAAAGWMAGSALVPRDSAAPQAWEVDDGTGRFSPNGDGQGDTSDVSVRLSEASTWTMRIVDQGGEVLAHTGGSSDTASISWAPRAGSVADGTYRWTLEATDAWGNGPLEDEGTLAADTAAPDATIAEAQDDIPQLSPNGDGSGDSVRVTVDSTEPGTAVATVRNAADEPVAHVAATLGSAGAALAWGGRDDDGAYVPDGEYTVHVVARDLAGNGSEPVVRTVVAYGALGYTAASAPAFFPQDGDTLARTVTLSFRLGAAATVGWTIQDAGGTVVRTIAADTVMGAGTQAFAWDGRDDAGGLVPRGSYRSVVTATDGTLGATQRATVVADAFRITASDTTPGRRQRITFTAVSTETLDAAPRLRVYQPGIAGWTVKMKKTATRTYRITITLRSSSTGTLRLRVAGPDSHGRSQASYLSLPLH